MKIFLSYGHDDNKDLVSQIKADLEALYGHEVWIDREKINPGDDWRRAITDGIVGSDWVLAFLSKHSTRDPSVCLDELGIAMGVKGGIVQTVLVEGEKEVSPPVSVSHIQWLDMHDWAVRKKIDPRAYDVWYQEKFADIVRVIESDTNRRFAGEIQILQEKLKPVSSEARIGGLLKQGFFGRAWLVQEIEAWRTGNLDSRVFWITGEPGIGKSALSAWLAHHGKASLIAAQFVEYNQPNKKDPRRVIRSIAFQIATRLPDYRKFLLGLPELDELDRKNATELFDYLLANPLRYGIAGGRDRYLVLIDALDEATEGNDNELVILLAEQAQKLPDWIGFIVTSRPEPKILRALSHMEPNELKADDPRNAEDLRGFLLAWFERRDQTAQAVMCIPGILAAAEGNFLYLRQFCDGVDKGWIELEKPDAYPKGLTGLYGAFFNRQFPDIDAYERYQVPLLELLVASSKPLPEDFAGKILGWQGRDKIKVLEPLGSFFPKKEGAIAPFHKSLKDWLSDYDRSGDYYVPMEDGWRNLGTALWQEFLDNAQAPEMLSDYAITELPKQMERWSETQLKALVPDCIGLEIIGPLIAKISGYLGRLKQWKNSESWLRLLVRLDRVVFGSADLNLSTDLTSLGYVLSAQGKIYEAESHFREALAMAEQKADIDSLESYAYPLFQLEMLLRDEGRGDERETLMRHALSVSEGILGSEHPDLCVYIEGLADAVGYRSKYNERYELLYRSMGINEKHFGYENAKIAFTLVKLASYIQLTGVPDYSELESLYRRAVGIMEKVLGPEDEQTLYTTKLLADWLAGGLLNRNSAPCLDEAESIYRRVCEILERRLGPEHEQTVSGLQGLEECLRRRGKTVEADELFNKTSSFEDRNRTPEERAEELHSEAVVYRAYGLRDMAQSLCREAIAIRERILGNDHPDTANSWLLLSYLEADEGNWVKAEVLSRHAASVLEQARGQDHSSAIEAKQHLTICKREIAKSSITGSSER